MVGGLTLVIVKRVFLVHSWFHLELLLQIIHAFSLPIRFFEWKRASKIYFTSDKSDTGFTHLEFPCPSSSMMVLLAFIFEDTVASENMLTIKEMTVSWIVLSLYIEI